MKGVKTMNFAPWKLLLRPVAIFCAVLIAPGDTLPIARAQAQEREQPAETVMPQEQLDSLVSPVALYPDPLLGQVLAASTYPLEIVEVDRWLQQNSSLQGEALVQAAAKQKWDPSIQALVVFPSIVQQMDQNLQWTTALGNAFLAQQQDVMDAVQRMRHKAQGAGALNSNAQQSIETKNVDGQNVIVIEPADPQVIYVPSYNPTVVYGAPPEDYPYPALTYPSTGFLNAASAISFTAGIVLGAAFRGCCGPGWGWGWGCNWSRHGSVIVNNNFFGRYGYARPHGARVNGAAAWAHNPAFRGPAPYSSARVAGRYGAAAGIRTPYGKAVAVATPYGSAARVKTLNGGAGAVTTPRGSAAGIRTPSGSAVNTRQNTLPKTTRPNQAVNSADRAGGGNKWGSWSGSPSQASAGAFRGAASGGASQARSSSNRGFSSMGSRGGGGFRGGGGRGGGRRR
jgi:uncharacterized membrane protein YgcG